MKLYSRIWISIALLGLLGKAHAQPASETSLPDAAESACLSDSAFQTALAEAQTLSPAEPRLSESDLLIQAWFPVQKQRCELEAQLRFLKAFEALASHAISCYSPSSPHRVERCRLLLQMANKFIFQLPRQTVEQDRSQVASLFNQTVSNLSVKAEEVKAQLARKKKGGKIGTKQAETEFISLFATLQTLQETWVSTIHRNMQLQLPFIEIPLPVEHVVNLISASRALREKNYKMAQTKVGEVITWIQNQSTSSQEASLPNPEFTTYNISVPTQPLPANQLINLADAHINLQAANWDIAQKRLASVLKWIRQHSAPKAPKPSQGTPPGYPPQGQVPGQPRPGYPAPPRNPQGQPNPYPQPGYPPPGYPQSGYPPPYYPPPGYGQPGYPYQQPPYRPVMGPEYVPQPQGYPQPGYPYPPQPGYIPQPGYPAQPQPGPAPLPQPPPRS